MTNPIMSLRVNRPKLAIWFRYGPSENAKLFFAMPCILAKLGELMEVHYYGFCGPDDVHLKPIPGVHFHLLPLTVNRASNRSKVLSMVLWMAMLPLLAIHSRLIGVRAVYIDDAVPFAGFWPRLVCGRRVAITIGDFMLESYGGYLGFWRRVTSFLQWLEAQTWKRAALIFVRSKAAITILNAHYAIPRDRMVAVYDACDFALFKPGDKFQARSKIGLVSDDALLVCYHGVLHPNKGLDRILDYMEPLLKADTRRHFVIIGNGVEYDRLKRMVEDLGLLAQVHFTGYMAPERVATFIQASDVGLVCRAGSVTDNLVVTSVLGRYMASGVPVLATRAAGIAEVVRDGVDGMLYDPFRCDEFQSKLSSMLQSEVLRARLAMEGRMTALRSFECHVTVDRTITSLRQMMDL